MGRGGAQREVGECGAIDGHHKGSDMGIDERRAPASINNLPTPSRRGRAHGNTARGSTAHRDPASGTREGERSKGSGSILEDVMRRKGVDEAWSVLEEMQRQGATTDKYTVSRMLMKTVGDGRAKLNAPRVYRSIALVERFIETQPTDVDEVLFNALLDTCCRLKDLGRLETLVKRMRELKVTPSPVTLGILVKTYGQAGDLQKVFEVWDEMEKQRSEANAVTYGCMIDACVKCGHLEKAEEVFEGMRKEGKHRNTILYTTLIKGYGLNKDLPSALNLFREMPHENVPYNTITYNSILDACVKCGDLPTAEGLLREMMLPESPLDPDLITFSTLLKGYCHVGELDKALQVTEAIKTRGLRCDELVYNTLMDGCVKANDTAVGVGLFEEMVSSGLRPSAITHSVLSRLCQRAGPEDGAAEAVAQLYQKHGIERPSGGDRGKNIGRRGSCNPRSPGIRGNSDRCSPSPLGTPSEGVMAMGGPNDNCWNNGWANMPTFPAFNGAMTGPPTPLGSPIATPIHQNSGAFLPMPGRENCFAPPFPAEATPYGGSTCTPLGSWQAPSSQACFATACSTPQHDAGQNMNRFGMPLNSPEAQGFGMVGTPMSASGHMQGSAAGLPLPPPWPACGGGPVPPPPTGGETSGWASMPQTTYVTVPVDFHYCAAQEQQQHMCAPQMMQYGGAVQMSSGCMMTPMGDSCNGYQIDCGPHMQMGGLILS